MTDSGEEFTFRPGDDLGDLKRKLSKTLDTGTHGVTCTACGNRVEGTFKQLLKGIQCKCGETVRLKAAGG